MLDKYGVFIRDKSNGVQKEWVYEVDSFGAAELKARFDLMKNEYDLNWEIVRIDKEYV